MAPERAAGPDWPRRYLDQLRDLRQLSPHTLAAYGRDLAELSTLAGHTEWDKMGPHDIRRHVARLHAGGDSPRSIARKLSAWRGFFTWLARHASLAANPAEAIRAPKRPKPVPKALSVDDAVHLVSTRARTAANPEPAELCDHAMFELLYSSGLRVSELAGLDLRYTAGPPPSLGWIDLDAAEVSVSGKGNKRRTVPVGSHALAAIRAWLAVRPAARDGSLALFLSARGQRIAPRAIQKRLKAHALRAGTAVDVHPHVLRHSFASHLLQSSGDLRAVQDLLGHASIASTQVYTSLDFQHLAAIYDKAHPRAKIK